MKNRHFPKVFASGLLNQFISKGHNVKGMVRYDYYILMSTVEGDSLSHVPLHMISPINWEAIIRWIAGMLSGATYA
jgi:hypothetical protein